MTTNLAIDGARLWDTLHDTARIGALPGGGVCRLALSDEDRQMRDWFAAACQGAGLAVTVDAVGNMFARREGTDPALAPIAFGSHLDTQPHGGRFDGILGVLAGLEVMRTLAGAGYETRRPLVLVNWTNEEGARFAPGMAGSAVTAGEMTVAAMMASRDRDGVTCEAALDAIGYRGAEPVGAQTFAALVELHIEQGPILESEGTAIGVVTGGQGLSWFDITVTGRDSHAGTTPMPLRRDAAAAFAEVALAVEAIALAQAPAGVGTVGEVDVKPGARNTIPGLVTARAEFRHPDGATLAAMDAALGERLAEIAARRGVAIDVARFWRKEPVAFDPVVVAAVADAARPHGFREMISGAGHDAVLMASACPTAMIFIPSRDGISHNEAEWSEEPHCTAGAQVLLDAVLRLDASL